MKLSVVVPIYNEINSILKIYARIKSVNIDKEIILVDDCSTDGTRDIVKGLVDDETRVYFHEKNMGKGAALRTGFEKATGDILIAQDADLEYDPNEYTKLIEPILANKADVVYGSRFIGSEEDRFGFEPEITAKVVKLGSEFMRSAYHMPAETTAKGKRSVGRMEFPPGDALSNIICFADIAGNVWKEIHHQGETEYCVSH